VALAADALHFSSDLVSSTMVLIGLGAVMAGFKQGDAVAAIAVALFILVAGYRLGKRTVDTLLDAAPEGASEKIREALENVNGIIEIQKIRARPAGRFMFVDVFVAVPRLLPLDRDLALLRESGIRVVFLLDDFDLIFGSLTATETSNLRPLRRSAAFILCTERSLQAVNPEAAGSPFFQTITKVRMSGLSFPEAQDLLADPARRAGVTFPDADIDAVLRLTGQHLYLVLLAGRVLWDLRAALGLLEQPETALAPAQLTLLQARLTAEFQPSFLIYMQRLEASEKAALLRLARGDAPSPADIALFGSLEFKGLITLDGAHCRLFSPLFAQMLLQAPAAEEARPALPSALRTRLTKTEQTLNDYLHAHAGRACTFEELWEAVWGKTYQDEDPRQVRRRIQVTLSRLREKLAQNGEDDILNVREVGYRVAGTP